MSPATLFAQLADRIADRPELVQEVGAIYQFDVDGEDGGSWVIDLKNPPGAVRQGSESGADCIVSVGVQDLAGIVQGTVDPQMAFMLGRIKVSGNFMLATKLRALLG